MFHHEQETAGLRHSRRKRLRPEVVNRNLFDLLATCLEALGRYKLRTALSVLGVVIGVAAVVAMMSVSDGARWEALKQIESLGLDNIVVRERGLDLADMHQRRFRGLTAGDAARLEALVPHIAAVTPLVQRDLRVDGPSKSTVAAVLGVNADYRRVIRLAAGRGRFLAALDDRSAARVCVLGATLSRRLFGYRRPVGELVRIGGTWYRVVGVLEDWTTDTRRVSTLAARDVNQAALIPLSAFVGGGRELDSGQRVDEIWLRVGDGKRVIQVGQVVDHTLSRLHRGVTDFDLIIPRQLLNQRYKVQRTFNIVVGSVAFLSLLAGGIGIMNIMLASVLERTHEIGLRRAVGATRRDITKQFLTEAVMVTLSGGTAGMLAGVTASWAITAYAGWATQVSASAVSVAFTVCVIVGLVFGLYPAMRATRVSPIDAVRYE